MITNLGTQLSKLQIKFGALQIDTENSATGFRELIINRYIGDIILISFDSANCSLKVKYPANLTLTYNNLNNNVVNFLD